MLLVVHLSDKPSAEDTDVSYSNQVEVKQNAPLSSKYLSVQQHEADDI